MTPAPWAALVLALGAFRVVRLIGLDDITASLRAWATGLTDREYNAWAELIWKEQQDGFDPWTLPAASKSHPPIGRARFKLAQLVRCPWCAGFWVSVATYAAWRAWPQATLTAAAPLALSAAIGLASKHLDK